MLILALKTCFLQACSHPVEDTDTALEYPNVGLAYYGILSKNWPCEDSYRALDKYTNINLSVVWNTFGQDTSCLKKFFEDTRLKAVQITLVNEVCQRNDNCSSNEFLASISVNDYQKRLEARDPELLRAFRTYAADAASKLSPLFSNSQVDCYISPGLESNLNNRAGAVLLEQLIPIFPYCKLVWQGHDPINSIGIRHERHHIDAELMPPCIANLDGQDIDLATRPTRARVKISLGSIPKYFDKFAHCDISFLWIWEFNGRDILKWEEPLNRTNWPTKEVFNEVAELGIKPHTGL